MEDPKYRSLMDYAFRALARRMHTSMELREKLQKRPHYSKELEDQILHRLCELKLIDDEAFVKLYIDSSVKYRFQGYYKILQTLTLKGIPKEMIKRIWDELKPSEMDLAKQALKKITPRLLRAPQEKRRQKIAYYLAGRGFSSEVIFKLVKLEE